MTEMLFEGFPDPDRPPEPTPKEKAKLSRRGAGTRRREKSDRLIANGLHPLTVGPLANNGHTCGDCVHRVLKQRGGTYPKCDLGPVTGGPATDVRASWPACVRWEALGAGPPRRIWAG